MLDLQRINQLVNDPRYHDYLAILKGARNGAVYGVKIRFPHALVMAILFGRGSWKSRCKDILRATFKHASNLAKFVSIYKSALLAQKRLLRDGKEEPFDTFVAGVLAGYVVFGERTAINEQMVLYVCSRVLASFIPRVYPTASPSPSSSAASIRSVLPSVDGIPKPLPPSAPLFTTFAALSWGAAVYLFKYRSETIQPGMWSSMKYLYEDSERWKGLKTLLWHNT